nr:anaerobic ribonucleoside-triphosphate reductase [Amedibacillus dolichus]
MCPKCGRDETKGEYKFEKIRRITGYLVGTVDRFNNGKAAEERDRVKHG